MEIEIRRARPADLPLIHGLYQPMAAQTRVPLSLQALRGELENPRVIVLTAWEGNRLAAFLTAASLAEDETEIRYLAVDSACQRRGIASKLIRHYFSILEPGTRIYLEVAQDNGPALAFYESMGAKRAYERKNYYKDTGAWILELKSA